MNFPFSSDLHGIKHTVEIKSSSPLDISKFTLVKSIPAHKGLITSILLLSTNQIVTGSIDATMKFYDKNLNCLVQVLAHKEGINDIIETENGTLISCSCDKTLKVWKYVLKEYRNTAVLNGHSNWVTSAASIDENTIASSSEDRTVKIWNLKENKEIKSIQFGGMVSGIYKLKDYNTLVAFSGDKVATFMDTSKDFEVIKTISDCHCYMNHSYLEHNGQLIVGGEKIFSIIDLKTLEVVKKIINNNLSFIGSMFLLTPNDLY